MSSITVEADPKITQFHQGFYIKEFTNSMNNEVNLLLKESAETL